MRRLRILRAARRGRGIGRRRGTGCDRRMCIAHIRHRRGCGRMHGIHCIRVQPSGGGVGRTRDIDRIPHVRERGGEERRRDAELDEPGRREVLAGVAAAVRLVADAFAAQPFAAEAVLVAAAAVLEEAALVHRAAGGEGRAPDERGGHPHPSPSRAGGARVVVHLPAGPGAVPLVRRAHLVPHGPADGVAEVAQRVQRLQRPHRIPEPRGQPVPGGVDGGLGAGACRLGALRVPRAVGGGPRQPVARVRGERRQQPVQPPRRGDAPALQQHADVRLRPAHQPVERRGGAARVREPQPVHPAGFRERRLRRRVRVVRDGEQVHGRGDRAAHALQRGPEARRLGVHDEPHGDPHPHRHASGAGDARRSRFSTMASPSPSSSAAPHSAVHRRVTP